MFWFIVFTITRLYFQGATLSQYDAGGYYLSLTHANTKKHGDGSYPWVELGNFRGKTIKLKVKIKIFIHPSWVIFPINQIEFKSNDLRHSLRKTGDSDDWEFGYLLPYS